VGKGEEKGLRKEVEGEGERKEKMK